MRDLVFACLLDSGESANEALRLAQSIRTFGGQFCFNPIWMFSQSREEDLPETTRHELFSLGVRLLTFEIDLQAEDFPFASFVTAAAMAETLALGETRFLAMMASDTLVLQPPAAFLLPPGKSFGGCPVHLKLLGSAYSDPPDEFWALVYRHCGLNPEQIFPLSTVVDEQLVRAYFNAGLLVIRPERGILRSWQTRFNSLFKLPEFEAFYQQHELYKIFMHQAILAGNLLSLLRSQEFLHFPSEINYPLHLHTRIAAPRRPASISQLTTCRYEDFHEVFINSNLAQGIYIEPSLLDWLKSQSR